MKTFSIILASGFAMALAACNTVEGIGRDVEQAGESVQDAAEETQKAIRD